MKYEITRNAALKALRAAVAGKAQFATRHDKYGLTARVKSRHHRVMTAISRQDYKALLAGAHKPKASKYKNHRVVEAKPDGTTITHDSKKEAKHWHFLRHLETTGEIADLKRQERFPLNVLGHKIATYVADFTYLRRVEDGWTPVVVDVKSFQTRKLPVYRMKLKLMKAIYGIEIEEVL